MPYITGPSINVYLCQMPMLVPIHCHQRHGVGSSEVIKCEPRQQQELQMKKFFLEVSVGKYQICIYGWKGKVITKVPQSFPVTK